ncbi:alpha-ketoacid dehydrogenase subunit alpha/beta [Modicisalibacter luteus]|uniref:Thiamine pyrophosphate-dependent enzyme n=1 Tax=Modicisalibacter luteus TaxID=453962 RepID=A0ABV7M519_9GAMM|nr:alpha-ketoacid dehydrogenase subunit alpha/beta [Halomonas lutea]GHA87875.1 MFS transporter [Halomonas lutea]
MKHNKIVSTASMLELRMEEEDWNNVDALMVRRVLFLLLAARRFEETVSDLDRRGLVHGPAHSSIGQEGGSAGCIAMLPRNALITGTHRAHHQAISKALHALADTEFDPSVESGLPEEMQLATTTLLADILGLREGWSGGRGGSMHLRNDDYGIMGTNAIVAGGLPIACGLAWAEKARNTGKVVASFFGDGAVHQGTAYEALNLAALYNLPILFFIENNRYSVSTTIEQSTREHELLTRAMAQGIPSVKIDGMNPIAVSLATQWAYSEIRENRGPVLIQADVYRYFHQSVAYPGSAFGYRTKEEEEEWRRRDPVDFLVKEVTERGMLDERSVERIDNNVRNIVAGAVEFCVEGKGSRAYIRKELWPDTATVDEGITGNLEEFSEVCFSEPEDFPTSELEEKSLIEVIPQVMARRMAEDETIFILGEDVANMSGGTVGATKGLADTYPHRVVNTPISENGFCGLAAGAAIAGMRPVIELMYSDFVLNAADQLFNQTAKMRHIFGGNKPVPVVLRCRVPGAEGYGSQHSMDPSGLFALYPGWRIVAPSNAFDYVGLMNTALRCEDPVLVVEHQALHKHITSVPKKYDYYIPIGKARRVREGHQVTLLATLSMIDLCCDVARQMGIAADIIDLRTLSLRDIDYETIGASLRKTNNIAIVEQTTRGTSIGAHIADEIQRRFFDDLDQPVKRIVGRWASPTVSKVLEQAALAGSEDLKAGLSEMLRDSAQQPAYKEGAAV